MAGLAWVLTLAAVHCSAQPSSITAKQPLPNVGMGSYLVTLRPRPPSPIQAALVLAQDELAKVKQAARSDVRQLQLELVSDG